MIFGVGELAPALPCGRFLMQNAGGCGRSEFQLQRAAAIRRVTDKPPESIGSGKSKETPGMIHGMAFHRASDGVEG